MIYKKTFYITSLMVFLFMSIAYANENSNIKETFPKNIFYEKKAIELNKIMFLTKNTILAQLNKGYSEEQIKDAYIITLLSKTTFEDSLSLIKENKLENTLIQLKITPEKFHQKKLEYFKNKNFKMPRDSVFWRNIKPE